MKPWARRQRWGRSDHRPPATPGDVAEFGRVVSRLEKERTALVHALRSVSTGETTVEIGGHVVAVEAVTKRLADTEVRLYAAQQRRASMTEVLSEAADTNDDSRPEVGDAETTDRRSKRTQLGPTMLVVHTRDAAES